MSEFVGRTGALRVYSYPEGPRNAALGLLARNLATFAGEGALAIATTPGTQIPWTFIASGAASGVDVPITPRSTGALRITGKLTVIHGGAGAAESVTVQVEIGGVPIAVTFNGSDTLSAAGDLSEIPIFAELLPTPSLVGVLGQVEVRLIASGADLGLVNAMLDIQEVSATTG